MQTEIRTLVVVATVLFGGVSAGCRDGHLKKQDEAREMLQRGKKALDRGDLPLAISWYSDAIRHDPKNAEAYRNRGAAYYCTANYDNYDKAIADLTEAIRLGAKDVEEYHTRYRVYSWLGEDGKAAADRAEVVKFGGVRSAWRTDRLDRGRLKGESWDLPTRKPFLFLFDLSGSPASRCSRSGLSRPRVRNPPGPRTTSPWTIG